MLRQANPAPIQLSMDWDVVHNRENNPESQNQLLLQRDRFGEQCWKVLNELLQRDGLTVREMVLMDINSPPRRIKDLKDNYNLPVMDRWVEDGSNRWKQYYLAPEDKGRIAIDTLAKIKPG
jgi:hypothetical protein